MRETSKETTCFQSSTNQKDPSARTALQDQAGSLCSGLDRKKRGELSRHEKTYINPPVILLR